MATTSPDEEYRYEAQVLIAGGKSLLERTIDFIRENVDIEDVYSQEQIKQYASKYLRIEDVYSQEQIKQYASKYLRIEDVYSLDDIEDYWKANKQED